MQEYYGLDTSLPLRKCGLKYTIPGLISDQDLSLPLRKCGLKSHSRRDGETMRAVTSLAEVWIEIRNVALKASGKFVTSLAEVWIEISQSFRHIHPVHVTSLAEVWIEIAS